MDFNLLLAATVSETLADNWLVIVIGLLFVFLVMGFLIFIVWGLGKLLPHGNKLEERYKNWKTNLKTKRLAQKGVLAPVAELVLDTDDEIAVVMGAVYAILESENKHESNVTFKVRSIKLK